MQIINELWARLCDEPKREEEAFLLLNFIRYAFFFGKFSSKLNSAIQRNFHLVCASLIFYHRKLQKRDFLTIKESRERQHIIELPYSWSSKLKMINWIRFFWKQTAHRSEEKKRESDSKSWNQASITSLGSRQGSHIMLIPKSPPLSP